MRVALTNVAVHKTYTTGGIPRLSASRVAYVVCCLAAGNPMGFVKRRVWRRMIVGVMIVDGSRAHDSSMIVRAKKAPSRGLRVTR
jgi:hypothetical protein